MSGRGILVLSTLGTLAGSFIGTTVSLHLERAQRPSPAAASAPAQAPAAALGAPRPEQIAACSSREIEALRSDLKRLLREELAAARPVAAPIDADPEPPEPPRPSPEAVDAEARAQTLIAGALSRRTWTNDDARTLRVLLGQVTNAQREDLLVQLISAMNDGRVKNEVAGPPF